MLNNVNPPLSELAHHGIKGQRWGVRKKEDSGSNSSMSKDEKNILDFTQRHGISSEALHAKYGVGSLEGAASKVKNSFENLTPKQKHDLLVAAGSAAVVAGLLIYGNKQANLLNPKEPFWTEYAKKAGQHQLGLTPEGVEKLGTKEVSFEAGHIFKRISTKAESTIKPDGFYAAAHASDVERYKAILPVYWKNWGYKEKEGFVVHLAASKPVKAPSEKAVFDFFRKTLDDPAVQKEMWIVNPLNPLEKAYKPTKQTLDMFARANWPTHAAGWNNPSNPGTKRLFEHLTSHGYNAIIDSNDAGVLAEKPIRMLDGTIFKVVKHEVLSRKDIVSAQKTLSKSLINAA